jgi:RimJ/RimL family protein N-acetyltransferase
VLVVKLEGFVLQGRYVCLEPLDFHHVEGLAAASAVEPSLYQWSPIPQGETESARYVETALAWRQAGTAMPFAIIRQDDGVAIGSTRFWNIEYWAWPQGHPRHHRTTPDACEIGYTWLTRSAIRTAANTESKLLMLTHAFEVWQVLRVCFHIAGSFSLSLRNGTPSIERRLDRRGGCQSFHMMEVEWFEANVSTL